MVQVYGLLRGVATYCSAGLSQALGGLNTSMQLLQIDTLATAAARFEQTPDEVDRGVTRMIRSNAGHPPPVVLHPDGTVQVLGSSRGELLPGIDPHNARTEQVTVLDRGATVLLRTDGLIESRNHDLDDGLDRPTDAMTCYAVCTRRRRRRLHRLTHDHPDDVALVAVRLHRRGQHHTAPPRPSPTTSPTAYRNHPTRPDNTHGTGCS